LTKYNKNHIIIQELLYNYTIMNFTTTTEIARKWSKIFQEFDEAIVLNNNKNIWLLLGWKLAEAVIESWMLQQLREELWELNDEETKKTISDYKNWDDSNSISMEDFRKKYNI
jgi:hypothetical protein